MESKIIANKSIITNTISGCTYIATKANIIRENNHGADPKIQWEGDLTQPIPDLSVVLMELYEEIKHGDQEHQEWLKNKIADFINLKGY